MDIEPLGAWLAEADFGGPRPFLVKPLWPSDAYGVLGAQDKAGKTWAAVDLAVSVANATPWFGEYEIGRRGSVVYFCGEGGKRNLARRFAAVAASKELGPWLQDGRPSWSDRIRISDAVPQLTEQRALEQVDEDLEAHQDTALVIIDPLYLASAGLKGSDLYEMGRAFQGIQRIVQAAGAALVILTHWNKTGEGDGASRFTGVGPGAWGRVLGSAKIEEARREDTSSVVTLKWTFTGSEIPESEFWMRRTVSAVDPDDLDSAMLYHVECSEENPVKAERSIEKAADQAGAELAKQRALWKVIADLGEPASVNELLGTVGGGKGALTDRLRAMVELGRLTVSDGPNRARMYAVVR